MRPDARRRDAKEQSRSAVGVSVCSARMRWRCSSAAATRHSTSAAVSATWLRRLAGGVELQGAHSIHFPGRLRVTSRGGRFDCVKLPMQVGDGHASLEKRRKVVRWMAFGGV